MIRSDIFLFLYILQQKYINYSWQKKLQDDLKVCYLWAKSLAFIENFAFLGLFVVGSIGAGYMLNIEWKLVEESGASMLARYRGIILLTHPITCLIPSHCDTFLMHVLMPPQNTRTDIKTSSACTYYDLYRVLEQKALVISNAVIISKQKATYSLFWPTFDYDETAHIFWLNRRLIQCCPNILSRDTINGN